MTADVSVTHASRAVATLFASTSLVRLLLPASSLPASDTTIRAEFTTVIRIDSGLILSVYNDFD